MSDGREVADAVLREGYVLYPYRASSTKNRYRFMFGVLAPRDWSEAGGCEPSWLRTQCLVRPTLSAPPKLTCTLRLLQLRRRRVEQRAGDAFLPVESLDLGDRLLVSWDEGEKRELEFRSDVEGQRAFRFELPPSRDVELVPPENPVARVIREEASLQGELRVETERAHDEPALLRVTVRVENLTHPRGRDAARDDVLPQCALGTHLLLRVEGGEFVSVIDPPEWAKAAASVCRSVRAFPVLLGPAGSTGAMLASPIILYDHPQVAPESPGDFFDACEIDELLTLCTAHLTDEEKREARATDAHAAAIVDRVEKLPNDQLERLHGAMRDVFGSDMVPRATTVDSRFARGMRVRLRPGARRTDAQDLLYAGRIALVEEVKHDVDGRVCLAVTIEDDPAAELNRWHGRFHHYYPDEVELVAEAAS